LGNTKWRTEPTNLEKLADDLWLGVMLNLIALITQPVLLRMAT